MKNTVIKLVAVIVALVFVSTASAVITPITPNDTNPAPFRGEEGTTLQAWTFDTPDNPAAPVVSENANGTGSVTMGGNFATNTVWLNNDNGHQGVWIVDRNDQSDMVIEVRNFINENPFKEIWVQIVYDSPDTLPPNVFVLPEGDDSAPVATLEVVGIVEDIDGVYHKATMHTIIEPNPDFELLVIRPRFCQAYIDEIIVETQCIPEPMTMSLLALGGLLIRRRR